MELEKSSSQTSDYTTKQHWLNSMAMEQKQTYRSIEHDRKAKINPDAYGQLIYDKECTVETGIYNGAKTVSSISGARKTGELHLRE